MQINKSDSNHAFGLAQVVRTGWFREMAVKSMSPKPWAYSSWLAVPRPCSACSNGVASDVLPAPSFAEIAGAALGAPPAPTVLVPTSENSRREERHGPIGAKIRFLRGSANRTLMRRQASVSRPKACRAFPRLLKRSAETEGLSGPQVDRTHKGRRGTPRSGGSGPAGQCIPSCRCWERQRARRSASHPDGRWASKARP